MKKKVFLIGFILLFNSVVFVWGQPNPNDVGLGAASGKPVGGGGGGADLGMSLVWLIFIALIYLVNKYRMKIIYWLVAHTS